MTTIYKIVPERLWADATTTGAFTGSPVDVADGYIHFSTAGQVRETAAKHFRGQSDLLIVAVPIDRIATAIKWEPSRGGALFPHLYQPLRVADAAWVKPLPIGDDGQHVFPEL